MSEQSAGADNSATQATRRDLARLSRAYLESLRAADVPGAYRVASNALEEGTSLARLCQRVIAPAMHEVGRLWEEGAVTVADEHMATAVTRRVLGALRPPSFEPSAGKPRAMLAAVQGEQHELALRMVADVLEEAGYRPLYLGADVPTGSLLQAIGALSPDLLGLSATMPESGPVLQRVIGKVRNEHPQLSLVIGGQATASRSAREGPPVINDLERLVDLCAQRRCQFGRR